MRKLVLAALLVVAGALVARRIRSRAVAPGPLPATPTPAPAPSAAVPQAPVMPPPKEAAVAGPPPPTTNGERVVLMSISSLEARGEDVTAEAVVAHVAAGEIDPDEGTIDVLLHRMVASGLLAGGDGTGSYRLTPTGQAALLDGSPARPSPATDAADELSSPTTNA